jgi:hypothetical protein
MGEIAEDPTQPEEPGSDHTSAVESEPKPTCKSVASAGPVRLWQVTYDGNDEAMHGYWLVTSEAGKARTLATIRNDIGLMRRAYRELKVVSFASKSIAKGSYVGLEVDVTHYEEMVGDQTTVVSRELTICPLWTGRVACTAQLETGETTSVVEGMGEDPPRETSYSLHADIQQDGTLRVMTGKGQVPKRQRKLVGTHRFD